MTTEIKCTSASVNEKQVRDKYQDLTLRLIALGLQITTMESCTSGLIASLITDTEGSSAVLKGAFVTYSNEAKVLQGVPASIIERHGVYSVQTAQAMAEACRRTYGAHIGVGVTGSFGNVDPNNDDSTPGEVFFALATPNDTVGYHCTVPAQSSRLSYKLYMANIIADAIIENCLTGTKSR
ncbi:MAG: CinA family protein [Atopobiaceae bacterium]|nr:CinA family protein [Atopobiaceae bacterium]